MLSFMQPCALYKWYYAQSNISTLVPNKQICYNAGYWVQFPNDAAYVMACHDTLL